MKSNIISSVSTYPLCDHVNKLMDLRNQLPKVLLYQARMDGNYGLDHFKHCFLWHELLIMYPNKNRYLTNRLFLRMQLPLHGIHQVFEKGKKLSPIGMYHTSIKMKSLTTCICLLLISVLGHRQAIFESKGDKLSSSGEYRIRTQRVSETESPADWMPVDMYV